MAGKLKRITPKEKKFAFLLHKGYKPVDSARKAFGWKCEPATRENQQARDLARAQRIRREIARLEEIDRKEETVESLITETHQLDWDNILTFAFERLEHIRDDSTAPANARWEALKALEKINDPSQDQNLIYRWIDLVWEGFSVHCPCCHEDFPLAKVQNSKLYEYRLSYSERPYLVRNAELDRRLYILKEAEKSRYPHPIQMQALAAQERHIYGQGAARAGKSFLLAMFALMFLLIPGVEIWILARVYEDARSEFEYLEGFLKTLFHPVDRFMYTITKDKKSGDVSIVTRWGSEVKCKSGKSVGSITGRELEAALVAEPGWVDADLFEEVRARMSSRLGRIIALGTPKGFGGFLGRLKKMGSRDMSTGRRLPPGARLIVNGCPWGQSIIGLNMSPEANPEYVTSELEAARSELTVREYASEFEGSMVADADSKFPFITPTCLQAIRREDISDSIFVSGVDQGERNFASCMLAWDGNVIRVIGEYFDNSDNTVKNNLITLNKHWPAFIGVNGGQPTNWKMTIFDADPPIWGQLTELEEENRAWKTEYTYRPKNVKEYMNWREETCMFANQLAREGKLIFDAKECDLLHEQLQDALIAPMPDNQEARPTGRKGWVIKDPHRGDHVPDAFLLAMWVILSGQVEMPDNYAPVGNAYEEAQRSFEYNIAASEERELAGYREPPGQSGPDGLFEKVFGRPRKRRTVITGVRGYYPDD